MNLVPGIRLSATIKLVFGHAGLCYNSTLEMIMLTCQFSKHWMFKTTRGPGCPLLGYMEDIESGVSRMVPRETCL